MDVTRRLSAGYAVPAVLAVLGLASIVLIFGFTSPRMYGIENPANLVAYWHIGLAWTAGIALFVTFLSSVQFLRTRQRFWNLLGAASGEIGFLMLTSAIVMGSLWGSVIWGVYWSWGDVRLVTMFVTWFVYAGYLVVFNSTKDSEGQFAATYGVIGFITIPLSFLSTRLWKPELHNPTIGGSGSQGTVIEPGTLVLSIVAVMLLYAVIVSLRVRILELRDVVIRETSVR